MIKVFVFYDTKYGNTKQVAEKIVEGLRSVEGIEADLGYVKEVSAEHAVCYDALALGAPNHMGRPSKTMKNFIDRLVGVDLKAKSVAVFGTYAGRQRPVDRGVKKLERMVGEKLPNLNLVLPGLSIRVKGVTGPVVDGELPKSVDFGRKIAMSL